MDWFKCYNGATTDKKFLTLSRKFNIPVYVLSLCWIHFCDHASQEKERGDLSSLDFEDVDFFFGFDEGQSLKAYEAFADKEMIVDRKIAKWSERQKNENAEKQKRYRERKKKEQKETGGDSNVTLRNVSNELPEEKRREEKREDKKEAKASNKKLYKKDFEDFWIVYPVKKGKRNAAKAFDAALGRSSIEEIANGLEQIIKSWEGKDPRYIPHPATWLNRDGWLDEPDKPIKQKNDDDRTMSELLDDYKENLIERQQGKTK